MKFFCFFLGGVTTWKLLFSGGDKNLVMGLLVGNFSGWGEAMSKFLASGGDPHPPSSENPSVDAKLIHTLIHTHLPLLSRHPTYCRHTKLICKHSRHMSDLTKVCSKTTFMKKYCHKEVI